MTTLTRSLPESLRVFIEEQVKQKGYGNTSEYLRSLVRSAQEAEATKRLEALVPEGLAAPGADTDGNGQFWSDLRAARRWLSSVL